MDHTEESKENLADRLTSRKIMEDSASSIIHVPSSCPVRCPCATTAESQCTAASCTMYRKQPVAGKAYRKCAITVGAVLGRYHPHGDVSVYDALVRLAPGFLHALHLVDGRQPRLRGRRPAAAYRYTGREWQSSLSKCCGTSTKDTVDFRTELRRPPEGRAFCPRIFEYPRQWLDRHRGRHGDPPHNIGPSARWSMTPASLEA